MVTKVKLTPPLIGDLIAVYWGGYSKKLKPELCVVVRVLPEGDDKWPPCFFSKSLADGTEFHHGISNTYDPEIRILTGPAATA